MKKIFLLIGILLIASQSVNAGILSNIFGTKTYYNNGYYYPSVRYNGYYPQSYYNNINRNPQYYYNRIPKNYYYNNQQPVIYRNRIIRKSMADEKLVANQVTGLEKLERQLLGQTFEYDSPQNRLERLEQKIFGASQSGELEERVVVLKSAAKNYKAFNPDSDYNAYQPPYNQYRAPIFTGSTGSSWRNMLWGNFRNQFTGTPTGLTPAMDPAYMDYFEAERALAGQGDEIDYRSNTGYYHSNTDRASGMGVTILD